MSFPCIRAAIATLLFVLGPAAALWAQDVTLTSRDGAVELSGTLITFDGEFYRIETIYGPLTVDAQGVQCTGAGCPDPEAFVARFAISGAARVGNGLMPALIGSFARRRGLDVTREIEDDDTSVFVLSRPGDGVEQARIALRASTTAEGFADLIAEEAQIVLALREVSPREAQLAREAGQGDLTRNARSQVLALDALVPIVAPQNPIGELTTEQLADVFTGDIDNWSQLGGPDLPIRVHHGVDDAALAEAFDADLLGDRDVVGTAVQHTDLADLSDAVSEDGAAIGLSAFSAIANAKPLRLRGSCGAVLSVGPRAIKAEDYPLDLPLLVYTPARRLPLLAREFLAFFSSPGAEVMIRRAGFVDQGIELVALGRQGDRLANAVMGAGPEVGLETLQDMVQSLRAARRLTVSFRFRGGSTRLDAQSHGNIARLARALEGGAFDGRTLVFVGFSDGQGGAAANRAISQRRADSVRSAVRAAAHTADFDRVKLEVEAYGEAMPVACDDSAWGREVNRRVEVWLR